MGQLKDLRERAEIALSNAENFYISHENDIEHLKKDLSLYHIELEMQNEDLRISQLELEAAHQKYSCLYDLAPMGYFTLSENGLITNVNQAGENLFAVKKNTLLKKSFSRYVSPESQNQFSSYCKQVLKENSLQTIEVKLLQKGSRIFYAQLDAISVVNAITHSKELLMFVTDIIHRKEYEKELLQYQQKMSFISHANSMDEFSSMISHELNHPLGVISNYLQGCIRRLESGKFKVEELLYALKNATQQCHRAAEIILRMKNLKYKATIRNEPVCLDTLIKETINLFAYEITDFPVTVNYRPLNQPLVIKIDKIQIQQVVLNLARNAIESMRDAISQDPRLIIEVNQFSKQKVEISICDNGPGFDPNVLHKLFDLHFTTKSYGVGLGLAVSRSVVEAHGGELLVKANPLGGVCATFTLAW